MTTENMQSLPTEPQPQVDQAQPTQPSESSAPVSVQEGAQEGSVITGYVPDQSVYIPQSVVIDLINLQPGVSGMGIFLIKEHTRTIDPNSKAPLTGEVYFQGKTLTFKVWKGDFQDLLSREDFSGKVVEVSFSASIYRNNLELTFTQFHGCPQVDPALFYRSVNLPQVWGHFVNFMQTELDPKVANALSRFFQAENIFEAFQLTWAGKKMHDAQIGGLMNHTLKMLNIARTLVYNDPRLAQFKDQLYAYIVLHDIGKVYEIGQGGKYTKYSFVSHRALGVEMISRHKNLFVEALGEDFFYFIMSVQLGHHGEYADKPNSVWALIVHLIDMLEAKMTMFLDNLEFGNYSVKNGMRSMWFGSDYPDLVF